MNGQQHCIRFLLNDKLIELDFSASSGLKPSTTVLNYLRSLPFYKGVKEGCAEGDCGACTVVIAESQQDQLVYKTIDSCLVFLPMLHGKQLITVEHLAGEGKLHPVQQAMVDENGSQCGYCTPGIVMSLFGLYKNRQNPTRDAIQDALTGNLCRCTGYRPIVDAAVVACNTENADKFELQSSEIVARLNEINRDITPLFLFNAQQKYYKPLTLTDALAFRKLHPLAVIVSGATDIALLQTKKKKLLPEMLDISAIGELRYFREEEHTYTIGAGLEIESLRQHSIGRLSAMQQMLGIFGSLQIRNLATLGGNIAAASPIGDTLPLLFAYHAQLRLQSAGGERLCAIEDFITGYRKTDLRQDEIIVEIIIPRPLPGYCIKSYKVSRRKDLDISTVSAGFSLLSRNGIVREVVLAFGGMAAQTRRAVKTENYLLGKPWTQATVGKAMEMLSQEFTPISDARSGAEYRNLVARNLLMKFYLESLEQQL